MQWATPGTELYTVRLDARKIARLNVNTYSEKMPERMPHRMLKHMSDRMDVKLPELTCHIYFQVMCVKHRETMSE